MKGGTGGSNPPRSGGPAPRAVGPPEGSVSSLGQALQPGLETRTTLAIGRP